ncbi:MAG: NUDIX domain-containing protein [Acholeplasmatales bacterium]|nr:NUDIX domain-containing protein [Acholeplasmatales bacterium]
MILIDQMKNLRIYRQQTFLPTMTKDKKKGSAILMMTPNFESSKKLMQSSLFINKNRYSSYYLERDIAYYIGQQTKDIDDDVLLEEATYIEETKRSELPDSAFGVPSKRKFPLDTEAHVRSAIKFFNYVDPEDEAELARRIIAAMKKFNITDVKVSDKNRFSKYYHPKKESTNEAGNISNVRFITALDGSINACLDIEGYDHPFRARSSMLILRFENYKPKIYLKYGEDDKEYHAPGGGWNEGESSMDAAIREAKEECFMNVSDVKYEGTRLEYYEEVRQWVKDNVPDEDKWWYGYYSEIFVGKYESDYSGNVDSMDKDPFINSGEWYDFEEIKSKIYPEYAQAVENYLSTTVNESYTEKDIRGLLTEDNNYLDLGDKIMFFGEATDRNNAQLKKLLYMSRIKNRKELLVKLNEVKKSIPFIEFAYPDIKRFMKRNLFIDLYYYNQIFFQNNTWVQLKGFNLYTKFMEKLINHPNLKNAGYDKKTVFIPVNDWCPTKDSNFWNYRVSISPISCIYHLIYEGRSAELNRIFGDMDVVFVSGNENYFKINFSTIDPKDLRKDALLYRTLIRKMIYQEEFEPDEIDTSAENTDSREAITNKIIDKIETSKGVDLTQQVAKATEKIEKRKDLDKKLSKALDSGKKSNINKANKEIDKDYQKSDTTKQDALTKKEVLKAKEDKKKEVQMSTKTTLAKQKEEEDIDNATNDTSNEEDLEKLADAIARAADNNDTEEDALDDLDTDEIKSVLASLSSDDKVDISPTRAARMNKMNQDLLNKEVNGKTVDEILNDTSNQEYNTSNFDIASPNEDEWKNMTFVNFDKNYSLDKDIINIFRHFATCVRPMVIRDLKVSDSSTAYDRTSLYDVDMEDYRGKRYNIKLDIPIMEDNRFLLRGNSKSIQSQFFNAPIIKTEVDVCQLISNYSKLFLYRFGSTAGKSTPIVNRIVKTIDKYKGTKIKVVNGYNLKVSNKYQLPMDYIDLSCIYSHIETPDMTIFFNQDEIRSKYIIEEGKGIPFAYHKKENAVIYFKLDSSDFSFDKLLYDILNRADPEFGEVFATTKNPNSGTYVRAKVMATYIPVAVIIAYYIGLRPLLDRAKIIYKIEDKLTKEDRMDLNNDWIQFSDGYVIYKQSYTANLLLNGLKTCSTQLFSIADIDNKNTYLEILDDFGGRIKADGLDNFRDLFIDPMVKESLEFYKLPTDFIDVLLYGTSLLADNKFIKHTDTSSRRLRRYQLIAVYTYKVLSSAYAQYSIMLKHSHNNAIFTVKRSAVIDAFLADTITSDDSCINALRDVETTNAVTTKGPSGMNSARAYSLDKRSFDESMLNVLGMSTGFAGNVGITRQTTMEANITPDGYVKQTDDTSEMNDANTLTATEALIPMSSTHDDPMRVAMSFVQTSKHEVRTEESDPLLVTSGADEAMVYLSTNRFAYKAKMKGKVLEVTDKYIVVEYEDGSKDFINLQETIEHNSDGGYYVPLKLDAVKGLRVGQKIDKDQVLAYDKYSFSNSLGESDNLAYNVGKIAKVAVVNTDEGFEDSGIISASMAKKLATRIDIGYDAIVNADSKVFKIAKVGDHIEASDSLLVWEDAFDDEDSDDILAALANNGEDFSELGKRKLKSEVTGVLKSIKIYRTVELDALSPSVRKIVEEYEAPIKETLAVAEKYGISKSKVPAAYSLAPNGKLKKSQNAIYIEFFVEYLDTVGIGDKVVYNAANKAVEKSIFPEGLEPYTSFRPNEIIDAFVSEVSIDKRLVTSSIISGALNKLMVELDRSVKDIMGIPYDDSTV